MKKGKTKHKGQVVLFIEIHSDVWSTNAPVRTEEQVYLNYS